MRIDHVEQAYATIDPSDHPRRLRAWLLSALGVAIVFALLGAGLWSYDMWEHHWRDISITVDGTAKTVPADTTLGGLIRDNDGFGRKPGALLSLTGKVLERHGGMAITASVDSVRVPQLRFNETTLSDGANVVLTQGADVTEDHIVQHTAIAFNVEMDGHGVIQMVKQQGRDGVREVWVGKDSHDRIDKGVIEEPTDLIIRSISPKPTGRKVIALTFDDGPSQYSGPILDILKAHGVKATFFDIGKDAVQYPQMEQRMVAEGQEVASHSNTHPNMTAISSEAMRQDITQGLSSLEQASGTKTKVFRAPYGAFTAQQWRHASDLIDCNVIWSIDTEDWKRPGADRIRDTVLNNAYNGAVVIMHDGGGNRSQDVQALPGIIDGLKAQGYEFVTIQQLIDMSK